MLCIPITNHIETQCRHIHYLSISISEELEQLADGEVELEVPQDQPEKPPTPGIKLLGVDQATVPA